MQTNHPDLIDRFSNSLILLASFGDVINRNQYEEIYKDALMLLMTEFKYLIEETNKDLAVVKYHNSKTRLLMIKAELREIPVDKDMERRKLIKGLGKDLTEMLGLLDVIKKRCID